MFKFDIVAYGLSLALALLSFIIAIYVAYKQRSSIKMLPKALRLFLIMCCLPFVFLISFTTAGMAIVYLFLNQNYLAFTILSCIFTFSAQMIRNFFFIFLFERIIATILLERFRWPEHILYFWLLTTISLTMSFICIAYFVQYIYNNSTIPVDFISYTIFVIHFLTIIICLFLGFLNRRMYRVMAYRISLMKRHQIMENIKILSFMFPAVMIYTFIAPTGSIILIFSFMNYLPNMPYCILHISQNLPLILVFLHYHFIKSLSSENEIKGNVVKNAFGKQLPTTLTNDKYFQNLKHQWQ